MPATGRLDRIRRDILRGAVDENLDAINGRPLGTSRRIRERRSLTLRRSLATVALTVLAGASLVAVDAARLVRGPEEASRTGTRRVVAERIAIPPPRLEAREVAARIARSSPSPLVPEVIPVAVGRVVLDPGHGGVDGGASMGYGLLEKDLTKDIANRLSRLLTAASWEVVSTRSGDESLSLKRRAEIANAAAADVFVSIHVNWLPDRTARGFETYYLGTTDDPFLRRLAALENTDSGFVMADYRDLLAGIYADVRQDQSRQLAEQIQATLFETLREDNPEIVSRGVMTAPFAVLVRTEMPAILVEVACLSNDREARLLALPSYRERIAEALYAGITAYADQVMSAPSETAQGSER